MAKISKKKFVSSAIWKMMGSLCTKGISVVVSIILARLLMPEDYGIVGLTAIFINLSVFVVQSGLGTALIRKEDVDNVDYTTVFAFCMGVATVCYFIIFFAAPSISIFYNEPQLTSVLRVQMLSLFLCALGVVRGAMITRQFRFRAAFIANLIATIVSGISGIAMAYAGWGVWALVSHTLVRDFTSTFVLFFFVKWKPTLKLSFKRMKSLLSFSSLVLTANLLDFLGNNIPGTIYGKHYSVTTLGYLTKGDQIPMLIGLHTFGAVSGVLLPTMAESQDDLARLVAITRKVVSMSAYILFPMMAGLAMVSQRLVILLFTEKWLPCVPLMIASCIYYGINPFRSINMQLIYALGYPKKATQVEILRFIMLMSNMIFFVFIFNLSLYQVAYIGSLIAVTVVLITQHHANRLIGYSFREWFSDFRGTLLITALMCICVFFVGKLPYHNTLVLALQVITGMLVYLILSIVTKSPSFLDMLDIIKKWRTK